MIWAGDTIDSRHQDSLADLLLVIRIELNKPVSILANKTNPLNQQSTFTEVLFGIEIFQSLKRRFII